MANYDPRWAKVTQTNFSPNKYTAHKAFEDTIRNAIRSKAMLRKLVDEEEAAREMDDEGEEEAEDELEEEAAEDEEVFAEEDVPADGTKDDVKSDDNKSDGVKSGELSPTKGEFPVENVLVGTKRSKTDQGEETEIEFEALMKDKLKALHKRHKKMLEHQLEADKAREQWEHLKNMIQFLNPPKAKTTQETPK